MQVARMATLQYADTVVDEACRRVESLDAITERLSAFREGGSRQEFTELFKDAMLILEFTDEELARMFKISRPTVGRWARGHSAPHPLGHKAVFDVLAREAKKKRRSIGGRF